MVLKSSYQDLDIPKVDVLTYLFPEGRPVSDDPVWLDAADPAKSLSPRQALQWVKRLGLGLDRLGVKHGEVVLIYAPNSIFIPVAYMGIVGSLRAFSAVSPIYTVPKVIHQLRNTKAQCLLAHPSMVPNAAAAAKATGLPKSRIFQFSDELCQAQDGVADWSEVLASPTGAEKCQRKQLNPAESTSTVATINYNSGTTGLPKGVCVSHHNLIANVEQTAFVNWPVFKPGERPGERWIGFLPY